MGFFDDTIGSLGKSLALSATSYLNDATGMDIGGTLSYLFSDGQTSGGATLDSLVSGISSEFSGNQAALSLLQNSLNEQTTQLTQIGTQLSSMATAIDDIYGEIQGIQTLLDQINQKALYTSWQVQDGFIKTYVNQIDSTFAVYASYTVLSNNAKPSDVTSLAASILEPNTGEINAANGINSFMVDDQSNKGALTLWVDMVCPLILAGLLDYRQAVDQFKDYYTKLTWAQLRATNLVIEAYNFQGDNALAASAWSAYKALILTQESSYIGNLLLIVNAGLNGAVANNYGFPAYNAAWQFHPDMSPSYQQGVASTPYYAVSPVFANAESFLARLALTDPDDRRIVVHMLYWGAPYKSAIDASTITITQIDSTASTPVPPSDESSDFGPMQNTLATSEWGSGVDPIWMTDSTFYVKRLVYLDSEDVPLNDGIYSLTNQNGQGALVPMSTYFSDTTAFQSDSVLGYVMRINATQQFDFMNFSAYFGD